MKKVIFIFGLALLVTIVAVSRPRNKVDNTPVGKLDLRKYMGRWYEIARFNHPFERGMSRVTADYALLPDGTVEVVNSGYKKGRFKRIKGKAKHVPSDPAGHLRVKFFAVYSDYLVMELEEENYSYALVGSSTPKFLWILSRTPQISVSALNRLLESAAERGYDISKLLFVDQR